MPKRNSWDDLLFEGAKVERAVLRSAFFTLVLLLVPLIFLFLFRTHNTCSLDSPWYYLWPPNFKTAQQLLLSDADRFGSCLFLNMSSIASALFLFWLLWRIYFDFRWGAYKFEGSVFLVSVFGAVAIYFASTVLFIDGNSPFDPSLDQSMLKNLAVNVGFIAGFYVCVGEILVCFIRRISGRPM